MSQSHGLGRGLSSLIPQKKSGDQKSVQGDGSSSPTTDSPLSESPFGIMRAPLMSEGQHPLKDVFGADAKSVAAVSLLEPEVQAPVFSKTDVVPLPSSIEGRISGGALLVPTERVVPNPHQPRTEFGEEKLLELAQSIRENGILQPLIVTRIGENYELIAGERRLQAAKIVGLAEVPVVVREAEDQQKFEFSIVENIQRHDLNPIEEARAYDRLSREFHLSQETIAKKMGKSRSVIANTLRLLQLPVEIQRAVSEGKISEGHAKAILAIENPEKQRALFDLIVKQNLTVREAELKSREASLRPPRKTTSVDPDLEMRERTLSEVFGTKVRIAKTKTGGTIRIEYFSDEEFHSIFSKLSEKRDLEGSARARLTKPGDVLG